MSQIFSYNKNLMLYIKKKPNSGLKSTEKIHLETNFHIIKTSKIMLYIYQ